MRLILGSGSKQRRDIFDLLGFKYEVITSLVDEDSNEKDPNKYVEELSRNKANSVAGQIDGKALIVAADTIIYMDGKVYEKPKSKEEAFQNIKEMLGKTSLAITGITIKDLYQNKEICYSDTAKVVLKDNVTDEDIMWYVENEERLFKVSGYVLLGKASIFLDKIEGDYNTVFGFSPSSIYEKFKELGYKASDFELV